MKNWFYTLSRGKQIAVSVLLGHLFILFFLWGDFLLYKTPFKRRKVAVNTLCLQVPKVHSIKAPQTSSPSSKKPPPKPPAEKKLPAPPAKVTKPQIAKENPKESLKLPPPAMNQQLQTSLLEELEASLEAIASPSTSTSPKTTISIPTFTAVSREPIHEGSTDEEIAAFLQQILTLPEFGEVKVQLAINKAGHLQSFHILSSKSEKNASFLKNRLPELQFPCLNEETSITVLFSNAL